MAQPSVDRMRARSYLAVYLLLASIYAHAATASHEFGPHTETTDQPTGSVPGLLCRWGNGKDECWVHQPRSWNTDAGDTQRLPQSIYWQGALRIEVPGSYRFSAHASGSIHWSLGDRTIIDSQRAQIGWCDSDEIELDRGLHPVSIAWRPAANESRFGLGWRGPDIDWEEIPASQWWHSATDRRGDGADLGEKLYRMLRCAACHENRSPVHPGPSLTHVAYQVRWPWLIKRLTGQAAAIEGSASSRHVPWAGWGNRSRMPDYHLTEPDARAIVSYLWHVSQPPTTETPKAPRTGETTETPTEFEEDFGESMFLTRGCLACHVREGLGQVGVLGGAI